MIDINEEGLEATAAACRAAELEGRRICGRCDEGGNLRCALKERDAFGEVDFLINYAGGALKVARPIEEMDDEINRRIIDLNLTSTIELPHLACATQFQAACPGYGKIINVSSACDRRSWPGGRSTRPPRPA